MAAKVSTGTSKVFPNRDDVHISFEDQQRINKFAKHNVRMDDLKAELRVKKNDLQCIEEGLAEMELFDEDDQIPILIGEVFLSYKLTQGQELLEERKDQAVKDIAKIEDKVKEIKAEMDDLKAYLYQRFGRNISLENDE